jgi:hypothetical protein
MTCSFVPVYNKERRTAIKYNYMLAHEWIFFARGNLKNAVIASTMTNAIDMLSSMYYASAVECFLLAEKYRLIAKRLQRGE